MGMIEGVSRPALAAIVPSSKGHTLLLDVGANVDAKASHLREFAVMIKRIDKTVELINVSDVPSIQAFAEKMK